MMSIRNEFEFVLPVYVSGPAEVGEGRAHIFSNTASCKVNRNRNGRSIAVYSAPPPPSEFLALPRPCVSSTDDGTGERGGGGLP